ncbi:hypothetical protein [Oceanispirochaeta sp.]|uniref:hypothetical protein n=1 Tax=Oceanispirochaeta sp. TaxID=2035350 RepID=UPI002606D0A3|nr:hypothetical protein [Oceanispirochaeta sp.]MDA3956181.1 hypothetical protein [Oceanispirochaeta sp.]
MKKIKQLPIILLLCLMTLQAAAQTGNPEENRVFAPFISRLNAETKGSGILLTWKDASNLRSPFYNIYESEQPFDPERFIYTRKIASLGSRIESFLYEPGDSKPRYFLILAEEEGVLFDVFIPYRNMTMEKVSAERVVIQEEKAARISSLKVLPESQALLIRADSSNPGRSLILFRSTNPLENREDLADATQVRVFVNETIELRDQVVPGISFYYALVDQSLYESGSRILLYDGSVTARPVMIPLEEWSSETAHSFQFASRHNPLPLLNIELDIERGKRLPEMGIPDVPVELSRETKQALAELNLGKSVHPSVWRQPRLLSIERTGSAPPETSWVIELIETGDWESLLRRSEEQIKTSFDPEVQSRLHFYKGQAHYFLGNLEFAFMDFLIARSVYYGESNAWMLSIFEQRRILSKTLDLE